MIYVRPFKKSDLSAFEPLEKGIDRFDDKLAQSIEDSDLAVTGVKRDGTIVGCGGCHPDGEHGELWLRLSDYAENHRLETLRWIKEGLKIIEDTFPFRQLNAIIRCSYTKSLKLIEHLGFVPTETKTINNIDFTVFSKKVKE